MNSDLLQEAKKWHELNIPVIPFLITYNKDKNRYDKINLSTWKQWEEKTQTIEEFNSLNWNMANGFGILLGTKAKNGKYLCSLDFDVKPKPNETEEDKKSLDRAR